jgi:hypothetical protein
MENQQMASEKDISEQQRLLSTYRKTLSILLEQQAQHTKPFTPPAIEHGISEARANIHRIKNALRGWGILIEDIPSDEEQKISNPTKQNQIQYKLGNLFTQANILKTITNILESRNPIVFVIFIIIISFISLIAEPANFKSEQDIIRYFISAAITCTIFSLSAKRKWLQYIILPLIIFGFAELTGRLIEHTIAPLLIEIFKFSGLQENNSIIFSKILIVGIITVIIGYLMDRKEKYNKLTIDFISGSFLGSLITTIFGDRWILSGWSIICTTIICAIIHSPSNRQKIRRNPQDI